MRILEELNNAHSIMISGHIKPDGDCIGSCMGLAMFLKKAMPDARVDVFLGDFTDALSRNIPNSHWIDHSYESKVDVYDVAFALDTGKDRLGDAEAYFDQARKTINIDHHVSNKGDGDVNYIVSSASSTCELIYEIIDKDLIDASIAQALYVGMVTDTGVFKYSNTSEKTMEIGGKLIAFGFNHTQVVNEVFYEKTYVQNQILGRALLESILFMDGRCIVSVIDQKTMDFYQVTSMDLEGIASQLQLTKGVSCAIFMYQTAPLTYKVSLRSNGDVDVAKVAMIYGGGGHMRAAGCTVNAPYHDIINNLAANIEMQWKAGGK